MWDPHTPYRADAEYGEPFATEACPAWLTEDVRAAHWAACGPHSAQECGGFSPNAAMLEAFPRQPQQIADMAAVRRAVRIVISVSSSGYPLPTSDSTPKAVTV